MLKANIALLVVCLISNVDYGATTAASTTVIKIPAMGSRILSSAGNTKQISYFYTRYSEAILFEAASVSASYLKVSGLSLALHHDQPMLYRIEFQGSCQSGTMRHITSCIY